MRYTNTVFGTPYAFSRLILSVVIEKSTLMSHLLASHCPKPADCNSAGEREHALGNRHAYPGALPSRRCASAPQTRRACRGRRMQCYRSDKIHSNTFGLFESGRACRRATCLKPRRRGWRWSRFINLVAPFGNRWHAWCCLRGWKGLWVRVEPLGEGNFTLSLNVHRCSDSGVRPQCSGVVGFTHFHSSTTSGRPVMRVRPERASAPPIAQLLDSRIDLERKPLLFLPSAALVFFCGLSLSWLLSLARHEDRNDVKARKTRIVAPVSFSCWFDNGTLVQPRQIRLERVSRFSLYSRDDKVPLQKGTSFSCP